jgi:hypothetical protein
MFYKIINVVVLRKSINFVVSLVFAILFIISILYYNTEIYDFKPLSPFSGDSVYNPYKNYNNKLLKANFHAHSEAYGGLTNGAQHKDSVIKAYINKGYDIACLSDYQKVTNHHHDSNIFISCYEHGYNIFKTHQIVIGSDAAMMLDFPLLQVHSHKQQIIKKIKENGGYISLAHPLFCNGYTFENLRYLRGYDFIEVLNHYRISTKHWDEALSAGYLAWLTAGDDTHNIEKLTHTFVVWNMIPSPSRNTSTILETMKQGCFYGVKGNNGINNNYLDSAIVSGNNITVYFREKADQIKFIGNKGELKCLVNNSHSVSYSLNDFDPYVRVEAQTNESVIYLNPFVRYAGNSLLYNSEIPQVNLPKTILFRFFVLTLNVLIIMLLLNTVYLPKRVRWFLLYLKYTIQ